MADGELLLVEKVWSHPTELSISFLQRCCIYVQLRNRSDRPIIVQRVECHFSIDAGLERYVPSSAHVGVVPPKHLSPPIPIGFEVDLALTAYTNSYRLVIHYQDGNKRKIEYDPGKYLVFAPLGPGDQQFFISHKDPEDTNAGRQLQHFLTKIGFKGYLSEDDHRPGVDLWTEKIPRAISNSLAVIFLWTKHAANKPESLVRELTLTKSASKHIIVALEPNVDLPSAFSRDREYYRFNRSLSLRELKDFVRWIERSYREGDYLQ